MAQFRLRVNGTEHVVDAPPEMPLLWVIRDLIGYTGTKFGCGIGQCAACTVHIGGDAMFSCRIPVEMVDGEEITTIEGLSSDASHPIQKAWVAEEVPQCGYCQPGMVMRAAAALDAGRTAEEIEEELRRHICRCGTYDEVKKAVARAVEEAGR